MLGVTLLPSSPLHKALERRLLTSDASHSLSRGNGKSLDGLLFSFCLQDLRSSSSWGDGAPWVAVQSPYHISPRSPTHGKPLKGRVQDSARCHLLKTTVFSNPVLEVRRESPLLSCSSGSSAAYREQQERGKQVKVDS